MEKISKKEADQEAIKIFDEWARETKKVIDKAKKDGKYIYGLDTNREIYVEVDEKYKKKIKELAERIDWNR